MMFNDNYSIPSGVAILSLLTNAKRNHFYELYILHNDIRNFVQCNIKTLEYNNDSPMKYLLKRIYTEVLLTEEFKLISSEIFNID